VWLGVDFGLARSVTNGIAKGNFLVIKKNAFGNFRYFGVFFGSF
jgi:hypothetical protein